MDEEILEMARIVREQRTELPVDLPETLDIAILRNAVSTIEVYLSEFKNGLNGDDFRYFKKEDYKNSYRIKNQRREIIEDAAYQLSWILENAPEGEGVSFREICESNGIKDVDMFRDSLLNVMLIDVHENAYKLLYDYVVKKEKNENCHS